MRVLHISKFDKRGGAAIAARNSVKAQRVFGIDARMLAGTKIADDEFVDTPSGLAALRRTAAFAGERILFRAAGVPRFDVRSIGQFGIGARAYIERYDPDVVVLHNIDGVMSLESIAQIGRPTIWRMHDMWAARGLRHYDDDTQPLGKAVRTLDRWVARRKTKSLNKAGQLMLCPPSQWLAAVAAQSPITKNIPCTVVPNGIDTKEYSPGSKAAARKEFGLSERDFILAFGASSGADEPRKGGDLLIEALAHQCEAFKQANVKLMVFGGGGAQFSELGIPTVNLDKLNAGAEMATAYRAADLVVAPSRLENLSLTVLESMACGTPVVAFNIGGMPDMIEHGRTGWLAADVSAASLGDTLVRAVREAKQDKDMRQRVRREIEQRFSLEVEAASMIALFERMLGKSDAVSER